MGYAHWLLRLKRARLRRWLLRDAAPSRDAPISSPRPAKFDHLCYSLTQYRNLHLPPRFGKGGFSPIRPLRGFSYEGMKRTPQCAFCAHSVHRPPACPNQIAPGHHQPPTRAGECRGPCRTAFPHAGIPVAADCPVSQQRLLRRHPAPPTRGTPLKAGRRPFQV